MADRVKMRHPKAKVDREVPAAAVSGWEELGWERAKGSSSSSSQTPQAKSAEKKEK